MDHHNAMHLLWKHFDLPIFVDLAGKSHVAPEFCSAKWISSQERKNGTRTSSRENWMHRLFGSLPLWESVRQERELDKEDTDVFDMRIATADLKHPVNQLAVEKLQGDRLPQQFFLSMQNLGQLKERISWHQKPGQESGI